jgi:hypothetical protein
MKSIASAALQPPSLPRQEIIRLVGERAANIFDARGYCCAEAVIAVLNILNP